jgi:hydrogenase-4 component F
MGVIAIGLGFATPLALAGVTVHIAGHAVAKSLGFYAAGPLAALQPATANHPPRGILRADGTVGAALGVALGALAGLPPSPLFVSEVMIVAAGFQAGRTGPAVLATVLLGLGFLGVVHALLEALAGRRRRRGELAEASRRELRVLLAVAGVLLLALATAALALPGSELATALAGGPG